MEQEGSDRIKSAFEKAMERVQQLESPTKEKRLEWKGVPEGNRLAARYLRGGGDVAAELQKYEPELRRYALQGILEVLAANVQLPRSEAIQKSTERVLEGLRGLFPKKPKIKELADRIQYVCTQYRTHGAQQRQQVYEHLKQEFLRQVQQALQKKGVAGEVAVNVEGTPEFQQEWLRARAQLDQQYEEHLEACRNEIKAFV